jgi:hypothetical protein
MPLAMRRVKRPRWYSQAVLPWLERGEVPADPFTDLRTSDNSLSIYVIEDDKSNLDQVVTAMSATCDRPQNFDYLLFDIEILSQVNIEVRESKGKTPDNEVNGWHRDLVEISGNRLLMLVKQVLESNYETDRYLAKQIKEFATRAIHSGRYELNQVKQSFREHLGLD